MVVRQTFLALCSLLLAAPAAAVSVNDRSPFAQGHWWDPARAGSGFDIFSASGQVGVVWFTFDESGRAVWYTAGGTLASMGTAWPLMKHRWVNGRKEAPTSVGTLRIALRHPEAADVSFDFGGKQGTWSIQPFVVAGVIDEVDHSGHWFDPGNSGWGFSLVEQGDVLGGALFTYDGAGEPTWVSGYERGAASIAYQSFRGSCPYCTYAPATAASAGRLGFEFGSETALTVRAHLAVAMAGGLNIDGARVTQLSRPASTRPADRRLAAFDDAPALKAYLDVGMLNIPPDIPQSSFSASPPPGMTFSPTNLQEAGVDEADYVKTDGRLIYTFAHDANGARQPLVRVAKVDNEGAAVEVLGTVPLAGGSAAPMSAAGLFLYEDKLVAVTGTQAAAYVGPAWTAPYAWVRGVTNVEVMTASATLPVSRWRTQIDGSLVASRRVGSRLYVVSRFVPWLPGFSYGTSTPSLLAANQQLLAVTPLPALLPGVRVNGASPAALVTPQSVYVPPQGARKTMADMIVITAIDVDTPRIVQSLAIVGTVETVYASTTSLFVATSRSAPVFPMGSLLPPEPPLFLTDLHQIRIAGGDMSIVGSASVEGYLGNNPDGASFRLSDYDGRLRVVTSSMQMWPAGQQNRLTILEASKVAPGLLRTVSYLPNKNRPQTLGKPYELLYGTRFLADRLYAVTFRVIDPLYVVDLGDAADPRIAGALEIPGFSEYLHPLPNGLLLGFGKDARPATNVGDGQFAWYQGLQLSLYDVSDASKPREIDRLLIGKRGSDSALLRDHHAFSALMQTGPAGTFAFPARISDGPYPQYGTGDSAFYPWQYSGLVRVEVRGTGAADARLVPLPTLVTHTAAMMGPYYFADPAQTTGRSVLFRNGTIYVGNGRFWRQDTGGAASGPY